jgi:aspartyl-tRNA(Asn)/glutamyl-tRNA(Gln) amidotransferase subunit A
MRIGIPKGYLGSGVEEDIRDCIDNAVKILTEKGAWVEEFDLEAVDYAVPAYYVIACAEASSNLSRFDGVKYGYCSSKYEGLQELYKNSRSEGFGEEVKHRMMIGAFVLSSGYYDAFYMKALKVRTLINQGFQKAFNQYDMILGPISPQTAPKLGESLSDPLKMYLSDIFTVSVNLAGLPAISLPCGRDQRGLPIGLQLIGKHFGEKDIIRAAYSLEQAIGYTRPTALV